MEISLKDIMDLNNTLIDIQKKKSLIDYIRSLDNEKMETYTIKLNNIDHRITYVDDKIDRFMNIILQVETMLYSNAKERLKKDEDFINELAELVVEKAGIEVSKMFQFAPNSVEFFNAKEEFDGLKNIIPIYTDGLESKKTEK